MLSGHHGAWPDGDAFEQPSRKDNLGSNAWRLARQEIGGILEALYEPAKGYRFPEEGIERNVFLTLLSGFVSVADWLASMQSIFPAAGCEMEWEDYQALSRERAAQAVREQGWTLWNDPGAGQPIAFHQAFPRLPGPRAVQEAVFEQGFDADLPVLALIEAPTGIGKTEIAFLLADRWLRRNGGRGMYVAMPTQATSNQMYERAKEFLSLRYPGEMVHLHLAHGHALLLDRFEHTIISGIGEDTQEGVAAAAWFLPRKRTLLGPFGVGTVDQVFLAVLQTKHFFVRLFGLYGKVLIFDEVHAYDTYQAELFCRLLAWLRALNVSVILLSATLPENVHEKFIAAYGGKADGKPAKGYPRLALAGKDAVRYHILPAGESRQVVLDQLGFEVADVAAYLDEKLAGGGCAAVICNTVSRAQAVYQEVVNRGLAPGSTYLFHARFPFAWRAATEAMVVNSFGPNGTRPERAIVVATQVIEQSLDLDFDLLVSELAPIDLLIQRAGRCIGITAPPGPSASLSHGLR